MTIITNIAATVGLLSAGACLGFVAAALCTIAKGN